LRTQLSKKNLDSTYSIKINTSKIFKYNHLFHNLLSNYSNSQKCHNSSLGKNKEAWQKVRKKLIPHQYKQQGVEVYRAAINAM